jgi:hypothetical protein
MQRLLTLLLAWSAPAFADGRKILGQDGLVAIETVKGTSYYGYARVVARVEDAAPGSAGSGGYAFCSGAKVGDGLFLTNSHCDHVCASMVFHLGYEKGLPAGEQQYWRCAELLAKNETLDYALYRATYEAPVAARQDDYPALVLYKGPVHDGQPLVLASHPSGRPKEIDVSVDCVLSSAAVIHTDTGRDTMEHMCDTEGGSSGAPILDRERGYAVGLHWGGKDDEFNYAIPMDRIVADLEKALPGDVYSALTIAD